MYFLIGLFIITVAVIGMNFCFLLIGGAPFHKGEEFAPVKMGKRSFTVERFAVAVSTGVFGAGWLVAWFYFLFTGWDSFIAQVDSLIFHVVLQFVSSIVLIIASVGLFRQWRMCKGIFLIGMATLFVSVGTAIFIYGPRGHGEPVFMYLIGAWTLVVGGFLTTATYLLDRLLHDWDEQLPKNKSKADA
jgi:hypothetical protein